MKILSYVSFILLSLCVFGETCVREDIESHLGTKTPYRFVANRTSNKITYEGCRPKKIWMLARHGTRNPSEDLIEKFSTRLPQIRNLILANNPIPSENIFRSQLEALKKWKSDLVADEAKKLTTEGKHEMIDLAERMQGRLPDVLPSVYSNSSYRFKYTHTQRTRKSAKYFAVGLFGKKTANDVWYPEPSKADPILRFYKLCDRWRAEVSKNPSSLEERNKFAQEPLMMDTIKNINRKLNLDSQLTFDDLNLMYTTCAFETAWNKKRKSPWCFVFDNESIQVMEYAEDLKYFWVDGYGYELTYKQACPAFNNMLEFLESGDAYPKATLYFTHSGTLLKMLTHLGLYYDHKPLLHTDYKKNADRKFRVSEIDTFGNNLAFVAFDCGDKNKLLVLHQEKAVHLPSCPDSELCDFDIVKDFYSDSVRACDFKKMCNL